LFWGWGVRKVNIFTKSLLCVIMQDGSIEERSNIEYIYCQLFYVKFLLINFLLKSSCLLDTVYISLSETCSKSSKDVWKVNII